MLVPYKSIGKREWGNRTWAFLHAFAATYKKSRFSEEQRSNIRSFFRNLDSFIPCRACQTHCAKLSKDQRTVQGLEEALAADSPDRFVRFIIDMHNSVNLVCGKPQLGENEGRVQHNRLISSSPSSPREGAVSYVSFFLGVLLGVALCVLGYSIVRRRRP